MTKKNSKQAQKDIHAMRLLIERKAREKKELRAMKTKAKMDTGEKEKKTRTKRKRLIMKRGAIKIKGSASKPEGKKMILK